MGGIVAGWTTTPWTTTPDSPFRERSISSEWRLFQGISGTRYKCYVS